MKKKLLLIIASFIFASTLTFSQDDSLKLNTWQPTAAIGFNVSQIAFSNWSKGGDNSITWTFNGTGGLKYATEKWIFKNNLTFAYGRTKLGTQSFRTNDNDFYLESVLSRKISWAVDPYFSNTIRTAIAAGYDYEKDPPVKTADFFDPGYITQSIGFAYNKLDGFNFRIGVALQETFTNKLVQYTDKPGTSKIEKFKLETGVESVSTAEYTLMDNLLLKSLLRLFSRFESMSVWDVRWDNTIVAKVNDLINVNFAFLLIYEKDQSPKTQIKEALQLGINYTIL